jgi:hypothetical protein
MVTKMSRIGKIVGVVSLSALAFAATPLAAIAADGETDNPPIPQVIQDSVKKNGKSAREVAHLDQENPDGTKNNPGQAKKQVDGTTFGDPIRYVFLELVPGSTEPILSDADFSVISYVAVQYVDGDAVNVLTMNENGEFAALGWPFENMKDITHIRPSELLASGGPDGDLYEVSKNLRQVRAVNDAARQIIGNGAMPVKKFRDVKGTQMDNRKAEIDRQYQEALDSGQIMPGDMPLGSVPILAETTHSQSSPMVNIMIGSTGAIIAGAAAYLLFRNRRRHKLLDNALS